jgi:hypothetical protein
MSILRRHLLSLLLLGSVLSADAIEAVLMDDCSISTKTKTARKWDSPNLLFSETDVILLRFDVASVLPSGTTADQIAKATLRVWVSSMKEYGYCGVDPITSHWREYDLFSSGSAPTFGPLHQILGLSGAKRFAVADVTELVRGWVSGTPNFGLALRGRSNFGILYSFGDGPVFTRSALFQIDSKENTASSHMPMLQIVLRPGTP